MRVSSRVTWRVPGSDTDLKESLWVWVWRGLKLQLFSGESGLGFKHGFVQQGFWLAVLRLTYGSFAGLCMILS